MKNRYSVYADDVMYEDIGAGYSFDDLTARLSDHITEKQLKDTKVWALTVKQFAQTSDGFGIDDSDRGWRCEYWGKLMRGACFVYRVSRDEELYSVLRQTVEDMLEARDPLGRFSTYSVEKEFDGWDIWGRKYVMLGMIYFLDICRDGELSERIISALIRHADYMTEKLGREEDGKRNIATCTSHWDGLNSCSVLEPFVFLYNITGIRRYLDFADYIVSVGGTSKADIFDIAYENATRIKDLPQRKAYEMMSCFEGLAEYVRIKDSEKNRTALKNFADRVLLEETSVIGCCGCDFECFDGTLSSQFDPDKEQNIMQETCVTVTWMKFCWQMLRMFGDVRYADALEISLYNAFNGAILSDEEIFPEENGGIPLPVDSYSPMRCGTRKRKMGGRKSITPDGAKYGCCVAIAAAGFGIASFASVAPSRDGFYFNLYRKGSVCTSFNGSDVRFDIDTDYPASGLVKIKVVVSSPVGFSLRLRVPEFSSKTRISVGKEEFYPESGYFDITREWRDGDAVTLSFDMTMRMIRPSDLVPGTETDDCVCFMIGPITLAADERCANVSEGISLPEKLAVNEDCIACVESEKPFECRNAYTLFANTDRPLTLVDYASAGHGDKNYLMAAWIKVK